MIEHDHVRTARADVSDFSTRAGPAIHRDEQLRLVRLPATLDSFSAEAVAFLHPRGQEKRRRGAVGAKHFVE